MESTIKWQDSEAAITASYEGAGDGSIALSSTPNTFIDRMATVKVTDSLGQSVDVSAMQPGLRQELSCSGVTFKTSDGRIGFLKE